MTDPTDAPQLETREQMLAKIRENVQLWHTRARADQAEHIDRELWNAGVEARRQAKLQRRAKGAR